MSYTLYSEYLNCCLDGNRMKKVKEGNECEVTRIRQSVPQNSS